jgi:hypothetical protein
MQKGWGRHSRRWRRVSEQVQPGARGVRKTWIFRYMIAGRARTMGLGIYPEVSLQRAREKAQECRRLKGEGIDPIENTNTLQGLPRGVWRPLSTRK